MRNRGIASKLEGPFFNCFIPAEVLLRDKEAGTFVVRDSTSYRGSFGLAMKVDQSPTTLTAASCPGKCHLMNHTRFAVFFRDRQTLERSENVYN